MTADPVATSSKMISMVYLFSSLKARHAALGTVTRPLVLTDPDRLRLTRCY
jgi:hypothetical protein